MPLKSFVNERSGDFEPLGGLPVNKIATLGLVSTKVAKLENAEDIIRRVADAAQFFRIENLRLSTQCGFASMEAGNDLTLDAQEAKLRLVHSVSRRIWS